MGSADTCLVTGYVRLDSDHRDHDRYCDLGQRLLSIGGPVVAYLDPSAEIRSRSGLLRLHASIDRCWYWLASEGSLVPAGNPAKDTRAFLSAQHQKTQWLSDAVQWTNAEMLVWIDFGILHVAGITESMISEFLSRAATDHRNVVSMPTIWGPPVDPVSPCRVAWHCAGGIVVVPRELAGWLHVQVRCEANRMLTLGMATWEVNTWSEVWRRNPGMFRSWQCDHDASLMEAGP